MVDLLLSILVYGAQRRTATASGRLALAGLGLEEAFTKSFNLAVQVESRALPKVVKDWGVSTATPWGDGEPARLGG